MTEAMFQGVTQNGRRYAELHHQPDQDWAGGTTQIVETASGGCFVGFLSAIPGSTWQHWGAGEGGFEATVARFDPDQATPVPRALEGAGR